MSQNLANEMQAAEDGGHNLILLRSNEEKLQSKERDVQDYASRLARARLHSQAKDVRDAIQETSFFLSQNL